MNVYVADMMFGFMYKRIIACWIFFAIVKVAM